MTARTSKSLFVLGLTLLAGWIVEAGDRPLLPASGPEAHVLTLLDYFDGGRRAVDAFVDDPSRNDTPLADVIEAASRSCVRVEIRSNEVEEGYQASAASGVLIDAGTRVLTAGHAMQAEGSRIVVTLLSGESRQARMIGSHYEVYGGANRDWVVLELAGAPVTSHPSAELAAANSAGLAIVLGYPDRIGLDERGQVRFDVGPEGRYLEPLVTLERIIGQNPLRLSPVAGSVPTSGMSGAPVFDESGRIVGIFVSIGKASSEAGVVYTYNATSLDTLLKTTVPAR